MRLHFNNSVVIAGLLAWPSAAQSATRAQYLMGTICEITAPGPDAFDAIGAAFGEIARWDAALSLYKKESDAARLTLAGCEPFFASSELWDAAALALRFAKLSRGAFDPTVWALRPGGVGRGGVGYEKVRLLGSRRIRFAAAGMGLDFGGIAKGIALDHAVLVLRKHGVTSAMINFGGQVYALGSWHVMIPGRGRVLVTDASVSTSGNSERRGHIISPFTGLPVLRRDSVTVVAPSAALADAWSTALFVNSALPPDLCRGCSAYIGNVP